ncbi:MAG: hypothetical protein H5T69_09095 [Chloroflexi bacterium]|nr:hypothetical protein [Chloroflexota bacterium]
MTTRRIILLAIAGVLLIYVLFLLPRNAPPPKEVEKIAVLAASRDIPPYTLLTESDVHRRLVPPAEAADSFGDPSEIQGMMTTQEIRYGNIVRRSGVLKRDPSWVEGETLIFSFYVSTSRIVGGQLRPGHHVDLLVTRPEQRDRPSEALWLANNLWVVGVYQASGDQVPRPTVSVGEEERAAPAQQGGAFGFAQGSAALNARQGPANLVVVAAHRDTGRLIADYLGAQLYEPWVYVRPGPMSEVPPDPFGRIDGLVFDDLNADQVRQSNESGLGEVTITLYGEDGSVKKAVKTASDGTFAFDKVEPGIYKVVETDPPGYESVSLNEVQLKLVAWQNRHVRFSDTAIRPTETPRPTATPVITSSVPGARPTVGAPQATPGAGTSQGVTTSATSTPVAGACSIRVYMSTQQDGAELAEHTAQCKKVLWAVVEFSDCGQIEYSVHITSPGASEAQRVGSGTWVGGSGKRSIEVKAPASSPDGFFPAGRYTTFIKIDGGGDIVPYSWDVPNVSCTGAEFPVTGFGFGRPNDQPRSWGPALLSTPTSHPEGEGQAGELAAETPSALFGFSWGR